MVHLEETGIRMITEVYQLQSKRAEQGRAALRPLGLGGGGLAWGAVFSAPPLCQWLWFPLLHNLTVEVAKDGGVSTS